jgi:hypothetical protein
MVVASVSWQGLARPSTTGGADTDEVVDGRHKAGHDTGVTGAAIGMLMGSLTTTEYNHVALGRR